MKGEKVLDEDSCFVEYLKAQLFLECWVRSYISTDVDDSCKKLTGSTAYLVILLCESYKDLDGGKQTLPS